MLSRATLPRVKPRLLFNTMALYVLTNFQGRCVELDMHAASVDEYWLTYCIDLSDVWICSTSKPTYQPPSRYWTCQVCLIQFILLNHHIAYVMVMITGECSICRCGWITPQKIRFDCSLLLMSSWLRHPGFCDLVLFVVVYVLLEMISVPGEKSYETFPMWYVIHLCLFITCHILKPSFPIP